MRRSTLSVEPRFAAQELTFVNDAPHVQRAAVGGQMISFLEQRDAQAAHRQPIGRGSAAGTGSNDDRVVVAGSSCLEASGQCAVGS